MSDNVFSIPTLNTKVEIYVNGNGHPPMHFTTMTWSEWTKFKLHTLPKEAWSNWRDVGTTYVLGLNGQHSLVKHYCTAPHWPPQNTSTA